MRKTILSIILSLVMVLPCFAIGIQAQETDYIVSGEGRLPFEDIPSEPTWYTPQLEFCYVNGVIKGQGNEYTFAPDVELSRATFVVMLARVMGADLDNYTNSSAFYDCKVGEWYTASAEWAAQNGYVRGVAEGKFGGTIILTREQGAVMIQRVFDSLNDEKIELDDSIIQNYTDKASISSWATEGVKFVVNESIMTSTKSNSLAFSPQKSLTRGQAVVIFKNVIEMLNASCEHEYTDVDCTNGKTCKNCGLVFSLPNGHKCEKLSCKEGGVCVTCGEDVAADESLHKYSKADCTTPETCSVCQKIRGKAIGHKFAAATCTTPKVCTVCKATEGSALGHSYSAATCTSPAKCVRCNVTNGSALGHTTKFGICTRCKGEVFASNYHRAAYYMVENAEDITGKGDYASYCHYTYDNGDYDLGILYYDSVNFEFTFVYTYYWTDGDHITIAIEVPYNSTNYKYELGYFDKNEKEIAVCSGTINPKSATVDNIPYTNTGFSGNSEYRQWLQNDVENMLWDCIYYNDYILDFTCGSSVADFGFTNFIY